MTDNIPMEHEYQAINWEDVHLRGIFLECDTSTSSLSSSGSNAPKISVPVVVGYIGDNLPNTPDEFLLELRKSLESVSSNGFVNWQQFKEASRLWVARLKELRWQDGNNNMHKTDFANVLIENLAKDTRISNRDYDNYEGNNDDIQNLPALRGLEDMDASTDFSNSSSPTMYDDITQSTMTDMTTGSSKEDAGNEVTEVELRLRVRRSYEENAVLRDELVNAEELIISLRQKIDCLRRDLEQTKKRCHQLERESDEQREGLNEMIEKQRISTLTLQRVEKQKDSIQEKLENAELEIQSMPPMIEKLQKLEKEKSEYIRQIAKMESELEEKQNECEALQTIVTQVQERTTTLQEVNDRTIQCLREQNQQLASENSELLAERSVLNGIGFDDRFSTSSVPSIGYCYAHSTPHKAPKLERQESLFDELKASGFTTECGGNTSRSEDLEEELNWYDEEIGAMLESIETVINELAASKNPTYIPSLRSKKEEVVKAQAIDTLKEKISFLQRMATEVITKDPAKDFSTQVVAEPTTTDILSQFGIQSFQDQLKFIRENPGTGVGSMNTGVPDEPKEDPFLKIATPAVTAVQEDAIIGPIVAALDNIIRDTSSQQSSPTERSPSGNFRSRSIYTYTSCRPSEKKTAGNPTDFTRGELLAFGKGDCPSKKGTDEERETLCQEALQSDDAQKLPVTEEQDVEAMAEDTTFAGENTQDLMSKPQCEEQEISSNEIEYDVPDDSNLSSSQISTCNNDEDVKELPNDSVKVPVLSFKTFFDQQSITDTKILGKTFRSSKFATYREMLEPTLRTTPQRKISVFHRSFDVNMLENQVEEEKQAETDLTSVSSCSSYQGERKSEGAFDGSQFSGSNDACKYTFSDSYRPRMDSGESSSSSPRKSDTSTSEDLSFIEDSRRVLPRAITLNPARLTLPRVKEDVLPDEKGETSASTNSSEVCVRRPAQLQEKKIMSETVTISAGNSVDNSADRREPSVDSNNYRYSSIDCRTTYSTADSNSSCSLLSPRDNENDKWILSGNEQPCNNKLTSETYVLSPRSALLHTNEQESSEAKVKDPGYSPTSERENSGGGDKPRAERAVALAMSSREESSDSECEPQLVESNETVGRTIDSVPSSGLSSSTPYTTPRNSARRSSTEFSSAKDDPLRSGRSAGRKAADVKQTRSARQRILSIRRSLSDGENNDNSRKECRCRRSSAQEIRKTPTETQQRVFPSLTDGYLQESGIANLSDTQMELNENLSEEELQLKYTAFSLGLSTDRVTLSRRVALSIRQRDQVERNLSYEVQKMQHDIQELAPLCTDRESMERVERVRQQVDMIAQCAHRVSCAAETLGAVHQENRISRAIHLADKYLQTLRAKCEKLAKDIAETKQILLENNIVIEEHPSELGDDVPRILRYRSGLPANNRTMMAKRRASIATISRPLGSSQDVTKEGIRQRNSVSGRVTLRRPSLCYETPKWENEKLDRSDRNSYSTGELRGICEHAESRRNSREENNNILRVNQTANHMNTANSRTVDGQVQNICKGESSLEEPPLGNIHHESRLCLRVHDSFRLANLPWRPMLWCILIFFFGFYVNQVISSVSGCRRSMYKWWSIEEILSQYIKVENAGPRPI